MYFNTNDKLDALRMTLTEQMLLKFYSDISKRVEMTRSLMQEVCGRQMNTLITEVPVPKLDLEEIIDSPAIYALLESTIAHSLLEHAATISSQRIHKQQDVVADLWPYGYLSDKLGLEYEFNLSAEARIMNPHHLPELEGSEVRPEFHDAKSFALNQYVADPKAFANTSPDLKVSCPQLDPILETSPFEDWITPWPAEHDVHDMKTNVADPDYKLEIPQAAEFFPNVFARHTDEQSTSKFPVGLEKAFTTGTSHVHHGPASVVEASSDNIMKWFTSSREPVCKSAYDGYLCAAPAKEQSHSFYSSDESACSIGSLPDLADGIVHNNTSNTEALDELLLESSRIPANIEFDMRKLHIADWTWSLSDQSSAKVPASDKFKKSKHDAKGTKDLEWWYAKDDQVVTYHRLENDVYTHHVNGEGGPQQDARNYEFFMPWAEDAGVPAGLTTNTDCGWLDSKAERIHSIYEETHDTQTTSTSGPDDEVLQYCSSEEFSSADWQTFFEKGLNLTTTDEIPESWATSPLVPSDHMDEALVSRGHISSLACATLVDIRSTESLTDENTRSPRSSSSSSSHMLFARALKHLSTPNPFSLLRESESDAVDSTSWCTSCEEDDVESVASDTSETALIAPQNSQYSDNPHEKKRFKIRDTQLVCGELRDDNVPGDGTSSKVFDWSSESETGGTLGRWEKSSSGRKYAEDYAKFAKRRLYWKPCSTNRTCQPATSTTSTTLDTTTNMEYTVPSLPSGWSAEKDFKQVGKLSEAASRSLEPVGPHYLAHARRARHKRTFSEDDRIEALNTVKKVEEDDAGEISEDEDPQMLLRDAKDWKAQDHYAVLGLSKKRFRATEEDIKKAHRKKVLRHHPDKKAAAGSTEDDSFFKCIQKANETLLDPTKRRQYDSVDEGADVEPPTKKQAPPGTAKFYKAWNAVFEAEGRFSKASGPVPPFGTENSTKEEVDQFYNYFYNFDSWRSFEYQDEEVPDENENRDQKRHMERKNNNSRKKKKSEDVQRLRETVDTVMKLDERIKNFRTAANADKNKKKADKEAAEKKAIEDAKAAKEKAEADKKEAEEKAKIEREGNKKAKEAAKNAVKKNKRVLKGSIKDANYFSAAGEASAAEVDNALGDADLLAGKMDPDEIAALAGKLNGLKVADEIKAVWVSEAKSLVGAGKVKESELKTFN